MEPAQYVVFSFFIVYICISNADSDSNHVLRITKAESCNNLNKTIILKNIEISQHGNQDYLTAEADLLKDVDVGNLTIIVQKCDVSGEICEYFTKFSITDFCILFKISNTFWAPIINAIQPRPQCPHVLKGTYTLKNATINMNDVAKIYPDVSEHYWKLNGDLTEKNGIQIACGISEGFSKVQQ